MYSCFASCCNTYKHAVLRFIGFTVSHCLFNDLPLLVSMIDVDVPQSESFKVFVDASFFLRVRLNFIIQTLRPLAVLMTSPSEHIRFAYLFAPIFTILI